jgi:hypothetical protein
VIEPACWSWAPPPWREVGEEIAIVMAAQATRPLDERLDEGVLEMLWAAGPRALRWAEFHTGVRASVAYLQRVGPRCAMCGVRQMRLITDHEHATGLERGLLCHGCNVMEGRGVSELARAYRRRNPASILGHARYYFGPFGWDEGEWWADVGYARQLTGNPGWEPVEGADW